MPAMFDMIREIADGRWFNGESPFRSTVRLAHPRLCVITGPNTSGKSLVRKILTNRCHDQRIEYISTSHEDRCGSSGLKRAMMYGTEQDDSTGYNSVRTILKAIQTGQGRTHPFAIMLDEPEIGCSEETQSAIGIRIRETIDTMTSLVGMFVVTHSRALVAELTALDPTHWHLSENGPDLASWLARPIVPTDLEGMLEMGKERWRAVQGMINATRKDER